MKMKAVLFSPSTVLHLLAIIYTKSISSQQSEEIVSRCIDLNFQAAALQGGDACQLFNSILDDGDDLFAADVSNVGATCNSSGGGGVTQWDVSSQNSCLDGVVDVVAGINEVGCSLTGGIAVSNFINEVNESHDIFSLLAQLACTRIDGESCYTAIQGAIGYCYQKIDNCLGRVPCDCVLSFINLVDELLKDDNAVVKNGYTKLDDSVIAIIKGSESSCRCEVLNSLLKENTSCAILNKILQEGDLLAGNNNTLATSCDFVGSEATCANNIIDISHGLVMDECLLTNSNSSFLTSLGGNNDILLAISDLACDKDCYIALQNCQMDDTLCEEDTLSCNCIMNFMNVLENLSPSSKSELLKLNNATIRQLQESFHECECDALNGKAVKLKNETYCSLYDSIISEGSIFVDNLNDTQSTCVQQYACIGNVTKVVDQISNTSGCELQQDTDELAQFFYTLDNSRTDLETMADFICSKEDCFKAVRSIVVGCLGQNSIENCAKSSTSSSCFESFIAMVDKLSKDGSDNFIGANLTILKSIKAGVELREKNNAAPLTDSASMNVVLCIVCMVYLFLLTLSDPHSRND